MIDFLAVLKLVAEMVLKLMAVYAIIQPIIAALLLLVKAGAWVWSKLHPRTVNDKGSFSHIELEKDAHVGHLESAGRDIVHKMQHIEKHVHNEGIQTSHLRQFQRLLASRSELTGNKRTKSARFSSSSRPPLGSRSSDLKSGQHPAPISASNEVDEAENSALPDPRIAPSSQQDDTVARMSLEGVSVEDHSYMDTESAEEKPMEEKGEANRSSQGSKQPTEQIGGKDETTDSQMPLEVTSEVVNNTDWGAIDHSVPVQGKEKSGVDSAETASTYSELTHSGSDTSVIDEDTRTQDSKTVIDDRLALLGREENAGEGAADKLDATHASLPHDEDAERNKDLSTEYTAINENTFAPSTESDLQLEVQVFPLLPESSLASDSLLKRILDDFAVEEIRSALRKRRISVDIKQTDISYDRGWVMMLEHGEWRTSDYKRDPMLLEKLWRYLYVVGWSVDRLHEQLMKTQIAQPDIETSIEG